MTDYVQRFMLPEPFIIMTLVVFLVLLLLTYIHYSGNLCHVGYPVCDYHVVFVGMFPKPF